MLTVIGVGTAFSLLIFLILTITVVARVLLAFPSVAGPKEDGQASYSDIGQVQSEIRDRDKGLAAAIAVSVILDRSRDGRFMIDCIPVDYGVVDSEIFPERCEDSQ